MAQRAMPKRQKKQLAKQQADRDEALLRYLADYGTPELPQDSVAARFDNQIKSIIATIGTSLTANLSGTIIDIGCGNGVLLERLAHLDIFKSQANWIYLGVDINEHLEAMMATAVRLNLHRQVDKRILSKFYTEWPPRKNFSSPHFVFIRNVFHELNIEQTAKLLYHVTMHMLESEMMIIQDLAVFPKAEKGNACWVPQLLKDLIALCGFDCILLDEPSNSGNRWFNIIATKKSKTALIPEELLKLAISVRVQQWTKWRQLGALHTEDEKFRHVALAKLDFDLQFAALTQQLIDVGAQGIQTLSADEESIVLRSTFQRTLSKVDPAILKVYYGKVNAISYFKDRANNQDALKKFLNDPASIAIINGPALMGKSVLVRHVLANFFHDRLVLDIDCQATSSVWNLLEAMLSQMACYVPSDVLSRLRHIEFAAMEHDINDFLRTHGPKIILVIDHFERLLAPDGLISDKDIRSLLVLLAKSGAKLMLTSRRGVSPVAFPADLVFSSGQPPVGRFPEGPPHVENLLDTFLGMGTYASEFLDAIDRHPFIAYLAAMYIKAHGTEVTKQQNFLDGLRGHMRSVIFNQIVNEDSRLAIEMLSLVRGGIIRTMANQISSKRSVDFAIESGLVSVRHEPTGAEVVACVGAIRISRRDLSDYEESPTESSENEENLSTFEQEAHSKIAEAYEQLYRVNDDPRWLREAHYHRMALGDIAEAERFGRTHRAEIFAAGEYWFHRSKDYSSALWAYRRVEQYGDSSYVVKMRIAASLIRLGQFDEGNELFQKLFVAYPGAGGIKSSYIDSLLYIDRYADALHHLQLFNFSVADGPWAAGQYGRAHMGLNHHRDAIQALRSQLTLAPEPVAYQTLAKAYHHFGDKVEERKILEQGVRRYPASKRLATALAGCLERDGDWQEALERLERLHLEHPSDGWIMYPLVKVLIQLSRKTEAERIWHDNKSSIRPAFLRTPIRVEICLANKRFEEATSVLADSTEKDDHVLGQLFEAFFAWADSTTDTAERIRIAQMGLSESVSDIALRNIPLLVSRAKLAILARNQAVYSDAISRIQEINPKIRELQRLRSDARSVWPN